MINIAVGHAEALDTVAATGSAVERCKRKLKGMNPQAGIVLAAAGLDHRLMLKEIRREFPGIDLVGGTTSGELSSDLGFNEDSVSMMVFDSDAIEIKAGIGRRLSEGPQNAIREGIERARETMSGDAVFCLAFPKFGSMSSYGVVQGFNEVLGPECPTFGGVTGMEYSGDETPLQFYGEEVLSDDVPFLLFSGPAEYQFSISNSWRPVGSRAPIAKAEGHNIFRIGEMAALDFYRYYLGDHTNPSGEFPLAVYEDDGIDFFIRNAEDYDEKEGSIRLTTPIREGRVVQLTEVTRKRLLKDTDQSVKKLVEGMPPHFDPAAALLFSCAARKFILGTRTKEELEIVKNMLPPGLPILGFYSFGEISPLKRAGETRLHNCTLASLLIGESTPVSRTVPSPVVLPSVGTPPADKQSPARDDLERENRFLRKKLNRSESYRELLEEHKERTAALLKKINGEVNKARVAIKQKNEALEKALALANEIQVNLLPQQNPKVAGFDIAGRSVYCSDTGGDYYDFLNVTPKPSERPFDVVVGDVTGHGIEAALLMTTARAMLRSSASRSLDIAEIVTEVNRALSMDVQDSGRFMTLYYLSIDPKRHRLAWVRAGHDPAIVYNPETETFEELDGRGIALGLDENRRFEAYRKSGLSKGEILLLGTDGIWETRNPRGELFGKKQLLDIVKRHAEKGAGDILKTLFDAVDRFRKHAEPEDDVTMVVIKAEGQTPIQAAP